MSALEPNWDAHLARETARHTDGPHRPWARRAYQVDMGIEREGWRGHAGYASMCVRWEPGSGSAEARITLAHLYDAEGNDFGEYDLAQLPEADRWVELTEAEVADGELQAAEEEEDARQDALERRAEFRMDRGNW